MYSHISESLKYMVYTSNVIYVDFIMDHTWFFEEFDHFCTFLRKKKKTNHTTLLLSNGTDGHQMLPAETTTEMGPIFFQLKKLGFFFPGAMPSSPNIFT